MKIENAIKILEQVCSLKTDNNSYPRGLSPIERDDIITILRQLQQENSELKAKLETAIVPKFKDGDIVYYKALMTTKTKENKLNVFDAKIIDAIEVKYKILDGEGGDIYNIEESRLYATEAEALESLKGE